jgi:hypothetical protein
VISALDVFEFREGWGEVYQSISQKSKERVNLLLKDKTINTMWFIKGLINGKSEMTRNDHQGHSWPS